MEQKRKDPGTDDLDNSMVGYFTFFWGIRLAGMILFIYLLSKLF